MKHSVLENVPSSWMILPRESSHCSGVLPEHSLEIPSGKSQLETLIWSYPDDVLPPPLTRAYYPPRPSPSMASTMAFSIAQLMSCRWIYRPTKKKNAVNWHPVSGQEKPYSHRNIQQMYISSEKNRCRAYLCQDFWNQSLPNDECYDSSAMTNDHCVRLENPKMTKRGWDGKKFAGACMCRHIDIHIYMILYLYYIYMHIYM